MYVVQPFLLMVDGYQDKQGEKNMKIALINEFSQASKNATVLNELKKVVEPMGHTVYNTGMCKDGDDPYLTYLNIGIQAALLLNSKAVDFVVTGCGTGQGAMMACNAFPGVVCGYCIDPSDAYLFLQINNGNALALPYAKGFAAARHIAHIAAPVPSSAPHHQRSGVGRDRKSVV